MPMLEQLVCKMQIVRGSPMDRSSHPLSPGERLLEPAEAPLHGVKLEWVDPNSPVESGALHSRCGLSFSTQSLAGSTVSDAPIRKSAKPTTRPRSCRNFCSSVSGKFRRSASSLRSRRPPRLRARDGVKEKRMERVGNHRPRGTRHVGEQAARDGQDRRVVPRHLRPPPHGAHPAPSAPRVS